LSRQLVARLGGTFDIASKPGVGTTVTIALPLHR
jgi:signal transduction histidine kinase